MFNLSAVSLIWSCWCFVSCCFSLFPFLMSDLSETILQSMQRSRRLLFVLSPDFLAEKSFSLLECRLGLYLQHGYRASVIAVVFRSVSKLPCVEVTQLRQAAVSTVSWRGSRSEPRRSRFWLRLRLALPVRPLALGRRLIDSTSSHSDLAALALQRAQRIQNHIPRVRGNQNHRNKQASAHRSCRSRQDLPRGRGKVKRRSACREEGAQHSRSCSQCAGLVGQVEPSGVEPTVNTEILQVTPDRAAVSDHAHNRHTALNLIPIPDPVSDQDYDTLHPTSEQDDPGEHNQQQQVTGSKTPDEQWCQQGLEGLRHACVWLHQTLWNCVPLALRPVSHLFSCTVSDCLNTPDADNQEWVWQETLESKPLRTRVGYACFRRDSTKHKDNIWIQAEDERKLFLLD